MGIKLQYQVFDDKPFVRALAKLSNFPFRNQQTAYRIARLVRKYEQELKTGQDLWIKLLKQYASLDEKGGFVPAKIAMPDGTTKEDPAKYDIPTDKLEAFRQAEKDFNAVEFEIPTWPVTLEEIKDVGLTAHELIAIEGLLNEKLMDKPADHSEASSAPSSEVSSAPAA